MPIGLHERCLARLRQGLADQILEFKLQNGWSLDRASLSGVLQLEASLPENAELRATLERYVNETPLFDYVFGELSKELHDLEEFDSDSQLTRLIKNPRYSDAEALAARLIAGFEALPRQYRFTFQLNPKLCEHFRAQEHKLTDSIRLVRPSPEFAEQFPLSSGIPGRDRWLHGGGLLGFASPKEWNASSLYIQLDLPGFVGKWTSTTPEESAVSAVKSILGTCLAIRAFHLRWSYSPTTIKKRAYVHEMIDGRWQLIRQHRA